MIGIPVAKEFGRRTRSLWFNVSAQNWASRLGIRRGQFADNLPPLDLLFCPDPALRRRIYSNLQQYLWLTCEAAGARSHSQYGQGRLSYGASDPGRRGFTIIRRIPLLWTSWVTRTN